MTLLTSPAGSAVGAMLPEFDALMTYAPPWMKVVRDKPSDPGPELAFLHALREQRFDAAVIFTVHSQSALPAALACHLAGIPLRLAHSRENPYLLLSDWVRDPEPLAPVRHEVRRQLDLVRTIGAVPDEEHLSVRVPADSTRRVRALTAELGVDRHRPWAVIHPGASAPSRRYPPTSFAAVARALARSGWRLVFTGDAAEAPLVERILADAGVEGASLAGALSVADLAALLAMAPVLISNNTGPVHLAAAVATPVVDLYALTNLQHAPWGVPSRVLFQDVPCRGCRQSVCPLAQNDCLALVPPEVVVEAAIELVEQAHSGAPVPPQIEVLV
jgi:lipopolysaccharide heptosyltransferase II